MGGKARLELCGQTAAPLLAAVPLTAPAAAARTAAVPSVPLTEVTDFGSNTLNRTSCTSS